ncbi:hypothetical protein OQA88_6989 [Cercophora sp. LCS_1]
MAPAQVPSDQPRPQLSAPPARERPPAIVSSSGFTKAAQPPPPPLSSHPVSNGHHPGPPTSLPRFVYIPIPAPNPVRRPDGTLVWMPPALPNTFIPGYPHIPYPNYTPTPVPGPPYPSTSTSIAGPPHYPIYGSRVSAAMASRQATATAPKRQAESIDVAQLLERKRLCDAAKSEEALHKADKIGESDDGNLAGSSGCSDVSDLELEGSPGRARESTSKLNPMAKNFVPFTGSVAAPASVPATAPPPGFAAVEGKGKEKEVVKVEVAEVAEVKL